MRTAPHIQPRKLLTRKGLIIFFILSLFVLCGVRRSLNEDGDDLSASYIGCRLIATGNSSHLYSHDPGNFSAIGPDLVWQQTADQGQYEAFLHPYVQTPLWAWSLQPLCTGPHAGFAFFHGIFAVITLLSFALCILVIAIFWAPDLLNPVPIALITLCLWYSEPFQYALALMQTHVLYFLLTLLSLILAQRQRPISAGILLALAAAVKITPGALVLYWLLTRRWKAAASMAVSSAVLWAAAYLAVGKQVMAAYLADLHAVSQVLLVSQNNQSFAASVMAHFYPRSEIFSFTMHPLPASIRLASSLLLIAGTIAGGLLDRRRRPLDQPSAPLGAMFALVSATLFAPISWSHYSIILIAPLMILLHEQVIALHQHKPGSPTPLTLRTAIRRYWISAAVLLIAALNFQPFAAAAVETKLHRLTVVRGHFYSEVLCLLTLAAVAWMRRPAKRSKGSAAHSRIPEQVFS